IVVPAERSESRDRFSELQSNAIPLRLKTIPAPSRLRRAGMTCGRLAGFAAGRDRARHGV
ncbi:MAG: hypothetical protein KJZ73_17325, partial [Pseudorhodoplanes sp.]|nr:hypothetical protein [Pseudorhodoplanes sp.]